MAKVSVENLLRKADLPNKRAEAWHPFYRGKIEVVSKVKIDSFDDFAVWYTPGVAKPCKTIEEDLKTADKSKPAAMELAKTAQDRGLTPEYIIPAMDEWEVFPREAVAVGQQAIKEGIARLKLTRQEAFEIAETLIKRARDQTHSMMDLGYISQAPPIEY
ncbi:hypothetical protein CEE45_12070 [Candidatus Heimdallarchaeota archaeon B3_Heim]|nr:MAG: hypothetical protein CEE45_12070 [Candidatus Heimdallarchaeota archaeon B3_Heim]